MKRFMLCVLAAGCANAYQSARTLAPGKTQATVAVSRTEFLEEDGDESLYVGELQVRTGFSERMDGGFRLLRNPGAGENISILQLDPKWQISQPGAKTAISIGVPIGAVWGENGLDDLEIVSYLITPSVYVGFELSPTVELVVSPKLFMIFPDDDDADSQIEIGGSIGLRFGDASRTWAVHPEVGLIRFSEGDASEEFLMFGIGIAAGN